MFWIEIYMRGCSVLTMLSSLYFLPTDASSFFTEPLVQVNFPWSVNILFDSQKREKNDI